MLRKLSVVVTVVLTVLPAPVVSAKITPPPADPTPDGRTPRQPRTGDGDSFFATPAPAASVAPGRSETSETAPAPIGVARSRVREHVTTDQRAVALTLDDGYNPDHRILGLIESYGIHGTAFILGEVADSNPALLNELARLGWLVCSHTYDHTLLPGRSLEAIRSTILRGIQAVERVVGYRCPYFRAPYGSVDANVVAVADELGVQIIGWETSISDSAPRGTDPELQLEIAKRSLREGSIVLGHFGGTNSFEVLSALLAWLSDEGYRVGSVAELIAGNVGEMSADPIGRASVTVELPGDGMLAAGGPIVGSGGDVAASVTRGFASTDGQTVFGISVAALLLIAPRRTARPRRRSGSRRRSGPRRRLRRRRGTSAPGLRDELNRLAVGDLGETVPEWERALEPVPFATTPQDTATPASVTTEGWT